MINLKVISISIFLFLTGCGSESESLEPSEAEGLWYGETSSGNEVTGLILDNGDMYMLYTDISSSRLGGVIHGTSTITDLTLKSNNTKDYSFEGYGILNASVSATVSPSESLNGGITYENGYTEPFTLAYDNYYDLTPSIEMITGDFLGEINTSLGYEMAAFRVSSDGTVVGIGETGCKVIGTASHKSGNLYNVSLTFDRETCTFGGQLFNGIIFYNSYNGTITSAIQNRDRSEGILYFADKQ